MTKRKRRQFSAEEKVRILRLHLLEGTPVKRGHKWCRERSQQNLFLIDAVLGAVGCGLSRVGAEGKALGLPPSPRGGGKVRIS